MPWPIEKRNICIAHDVVLMQPIVNKNNTYLRFLHANSWVFDYFGNMQPDFGKKMRTKKHHDNLLFNFLDNTAMVLQRIYMKKKKTSELTSKHMIHFNKNDSVPEILKKYKNISESFRNLLSS